MSATLTIKSKNEPHADVIISGNKHGLTKLLVAIEEVLNMDGGSCSFNAFDEDGEQYIIQVKKSD